MASITTPRKNSGSDVSSPVGETTPWGERMKHATIDEAAKDEWVSVQKKTFTRWCNSYLKQRGLEINDLFTDVSDGINLLNLLEIIGGDSIYAICKRRWNAKPKLRIHHLENCNLIFEYLKKKELHLTNIGSTDIVDTNKKLVLGLLWTIILRFAIAEDGKQGLLLWCRRSTEGYNGVSIDNFDFSWKDGRGFLALINKYRPDVLDYDNSVSNDPRANLALAFSVARDKLGIDALLDPEDLVDSAKPDEKSIMAYLSLFFQKFASLTRKTALVDSVIKAIAVTRKHDGLIQRYRSSARALSNWITEHTAKLQSADDSHSTQEIKAKMDALQEYRKTEKPANKAVLLELNSILGQLRTSQRSNQRPIFVPEPELSDKTLWEEKWPQLEAAESACEQALIEKYARFQVMDFIITKIQNKLGKLEPWLESRQKYFDTTDYGNSVSSCEQKLSSVQAFEAQAEVYEGLLSEAQRLATELSDEHGQVAPTNARLGAAAELLAKIKKMADAYRAGVEQRLALEKELMSSALKYSTLANEAIFVLDEFDEAMTEPVLGNSVEEVQAIKDKFQGLSQRFVGFSAKIAELEALASKITEAGHAKTLETPIASLKATYDRLQASIAAREAQLNQAVDDTEKKVGVRRSFAEAADAVNTYIQETTEASNFAQRRSSVMTPDSITAALHKLKEDYKTNGKAKMQRAEDASAAQDAAGVVVNGFTVQTIYSLRTSYDELAKLLDSRLEAHLAALAAAQSQSALSEEQWKEVTKVFELLDKDKDGSLNIKEFKDGLQGMGVVMDDSAADHRFASLCKRSPGHLTLAEFGEYMVAQLKAGCSQEDVMTAFKTLAGGDTITSEQIALYFNQDDTGSYILQHMPQKDDAYVFQPFVVNIFQR